MSRVLNWFSFVLNRRMLVIVFCLILFGSCKKTADGTDEIKVATLSINTPDSISLAGPKLVCNIDTDLTLYNYTYGFCYDTTRNPRIPGTASAAENYASGQFSLIIPDVPFGKLYYVRAFVTNGTTVRYSNLDSFFLPLFLGTSKAHNISVRSFEIGISRKLFSNTIDKWGVCYGTSPRPTISNFTQFSNSTDTGITLLKVSDTLKPGMLYYARSVLVSEGLAYYGNQVSFTTAGFRGGTGGFVFFDRGDTTAGWRYLEAANDTATGNTVSWGCSGTLIPGLQTGIGSGLENSNAITASCTNADIAAAICRNLRRSGKSDWYLPDSSELSAYYQLRLSRLVTRKYRLFSSTQLDADACVILDSTGQMLSLPKAATNALILPVRRF